MLDRPAAARPRLRVLRYEPEPGAPDAAATGHRHGTADPGPPRTRPEPAYPRPCDPASRRHGRHTVRLIVEVLDGRRAPAHLAPHLTPAAVRYVRAACGRYRGPSRLVRIRGHQPAARVAEIAAVVRAGSRYRALALRIEQPEGAPAWRCTAVRIG